MENIKEKTEQIILDAAISTFISDGYNGVSMQMIANESGTNKALLHYYFRSKKQLFEKTFKLVATDFLKSISVVVESKEQLFDKIRHLIKAIVLYSRSKPDYVYFLITEMKRDKNLISLFEYLLPVQFKKGLLVFFHQVNDAVEARQIKQIQARELLKIIFTICISEVVNNHFFEGLLGKGKEKSLQIESEIKQKTEQILKIIN